MTEMKKVQIQLYLPSLQLLRFFLFSSFSSSGLPEHSLRPLNVVFQVASNTSENSEPCDCYRALLFFLCNWCECLSDKLNSFCDWLMRI